MDGDDGLDALGEPLGLVDLEGDPTCLVLCEQIDTYDDNRVRIVLVAALLALDELGWRPPRGGA